MSDYSEAQITTALAATIRGVADSGVVLSDMRLIENPVEVITLIESLNVPTNEPKGWLVTLARQNERDDDSGCQINQTLTYKLETLYPYRHKRPDGQTSDAAFHSMVSAVSSALRLSRNLGLDNRVWHNLMQSEEDFQIAHFEGTGIDTRTVHFARFNLEVVNMIFV